MNRGFTFTNEELAKLADTEGPMYHTLGFDRFWELALAVAPSVLKGAQDMMDLIFTGSDDWSDPGKNDRFPIFAKHLPILIFFAQYNSEYLHVCRKYDESEKSLGDKISHVKVWRRFTRAPVVPLLSHYIFSNKIPTPTEAYLESCFDDECFPPKSTEANGPPKYVPRYKLRFCCLYCGDEDTHDHRTCPHLEPLKQAIPLLCNELGVEPFDFEEFLNRTESRRLSGNE